MRPWYVTREEVMSATDIKSTARMNHQVDRACNSASRSVENITHRVFYPTQATRYFPWPNIWQPTPWVLWLEQDELISLTGVSSGEIPLDILTVNTEPINSGPPFTRLELNLGSSAGFSGGSTAQRNIAVTGLFGYQNDEEDLGCTLAADIGDADPLINVSDSAIIGVGDLIRMEDERMMVYGKVTSSTGVTLSADIANTNNVNGLSVSSIGDLSLGETITIDTERMEIIDIFGSVVSVKRAVDGTTIAAHTSGATIYAARTLQVERGALGTEAVAHTSGASVVRHVAPGPVRDFALAAAVSQVLQETSGYGRTVGSGENEREASGRGLAKKQRELYEQYGRKYRHLAV